MHQPLVVLPVLHVGAQGLGVHELPQGQALPTWIGRQDAKIIGFKKTTFSLFLTLNLYISLFPFFLKKKINSFSTRKYEFEVAKQEGKGV